MQPLQWQNGQPSEQPAGGRRGSMRDAAASVAERAAKRAACGWEEREHERCSRFSGRTGSQAGSLRVGGERFLKGRKNSLPRFTHPRPDLQRSTHTMRSTCKSSSSEVRRVRQDQASGRSAHTASPKSVRASASNCGRRVDAWSWQIMA